MDYSVLLIENDEDVAQSIQRALVDLGFRVELLQEIERAEQQLRENEYHLLILGINKHTVHALSFCRYLREQGMDLPILTVSACSEAMTRVLSFELGADGFLLRPFSTREFHARVRALLRRGETKGQSEVSRSESLMLDFGELKIYPSQRLVTVRGRSVELTAMEFNLLVYLASSPGIPCTREQLVEDVLGYSSSGYTPAINTHIYRIRSKIESNAEEPRYVQTVYGVGYKFVSENPIPKIANLHSEFETVQQGREAKEM